MIRAKSAMQGVINRPAREELKEEALEIEDFISNEHQFDQVISGDVNMLQKVRSTHVS